MSMENVDETIIDNLRLDNLSASKASQSKNINNHTKSLKTLNGNQRNANLNNSHHHAHTHQRYQNKYGKTNGTTGINGHHIEATNTNHQIASKNKKQKRLPWNTKVLEGK